jgi:hypothetical protein
MQTNADNKAAITTNKTPPDWEMVPEIMIPLVGEVKELLTTKQIEVIADGVSEDLASKIGSMSDESELHAGRLTAYLPDSENVKEIIDLIVKSNASLISLNPRRRTLEKLFVDTVRGGR